MGPRSVTAGVLRAPPPPPRAQELAVNSPDLAFVLIVGIFVMELLEVLGILPS